MRFISHLTFQNKKHAGRTLHNRLAFYQNRDEISIVPTSVHNAVVVAATVRAAMEAARFAAVAAFAAAADAATSCFLARGETGALRHRGDAGEDAEPPRDARASSNARSSIECASSTVGGSLRFCQRGDAKEGVGFSREVFRAWRAASRLSWDDCSSSCDLTIIISFLRRAISISSHGLNALQ